jgi:hypothetical protein
MLDIPQTFHCQTSSVSHSQVMTAARDQRRKAFSQFKYSIASAAKRLSSSLSSKPKDMNTIMKIETP